MHAARSEERGGRCVDKKGPIKKGKERKERKTGAKTALATGRRSRIPDEGGRFQWTSVGGHSGPLDHSKDEKDEKDTKDTKGDPKGRKRGGIDQKSKGDMKEKEEKVTRRRGKGRDRKKFLTEGQNQASQLIQRQLNGMLHRDPLHFMHCIF